MFSHDKFGKFLQQNTTHFQNPLSRLCLWIHIVKKITINSKVELKKSKTPTLSYLWSINFEKVGWAHIQEAF